MKKFVWLAIMTMVLFQGSATPVFSGMQSSNFNIPTAHFPGGGVAMGSADFKIQSSLGQSSPLMDTTTPPYSLLYKLYPGYWYTLNAEMGDCSLAAFAMAFGSLSSDVNYSLMCDLDDDGDVDGSDLYDFINE